MIFGSAMMIALSPLSPITFKKLVSCCDTPTNRIYLINFKKDAEMLKESLDKITKLYSTPEARRASVMISRGKYSSEEEKKELEEILANSDLSVSEIQNVNGKNVKISTEARVLLSYLSTKEFRDSLDRIINSIKISKEGSGVVVLGNRLHSLIHRSNENSILYNVSRMFNSKRFKKSDLEILEREVNILTEYVKEDGPSEQSLNEYSELSELMLTLQDFIPTPDYLNKNIFIDYPLTIDRMYELSKELFNLGVVGFTPFSEQFFEEFRSSVSYATEVDLSIYPGTALFNVYQDLKEVLNSYKAIEGGVYS